MTGEGGEADANLRWGAASNPLEAAVQLNLIKYLDAVPRYGSVVDVGAGIAHSMEALLYIRRPDLKVASVDPGYALQGDQEKIEAAEVRDAVIDCFSESEQQVLRNADAWYASRIDAYADNLPFASGSMDLVFSYAAVPEYSSGPEQDAKDLAEMLRVVKKGGAILNGPMNEIVYEDWSKMLENVRSSGDIQKYEIHMAELEEVGTVYFSEIIK